MVCITWVPQCLNQLDVGTVVLVKRKTTQCQVLSLTQSTNNGRLIFGPLSRETKQSHFHLCCTCTMTFNTFYYISKASIEEKKRHAHGNGSKHEVWKVLVKLLQQINTSRQCSCSYFKAMYNYLLSSSPSAC